MTSGIVAELAAELSLGALLERLAREHGGYELAAHWQQGEFHHDVVVRVRERGALPGDVVVVATNCNGGVKEVLVFDDVPDRWALWHHRCPENPEFAGTLGTILAREVTAHWFDPCVLLAGDARSELLAAHRTRQRGGGWCKR
jgi:hypothetical protein